MKKENTRVLREGAMMVALTAILMVLTKYMPLFSVVGTFVCGVPMAALAARNGFKVLVPALLAVFVISIFIDGNVISAASMLLMSVIPGAAAGYMMGRRKPFFMTLFATCLAVCVGWIFELIVIEALMDNGIEKLLAEFMTQLESMLNASIGAFGNAVSEASGISPEEFLNTFMQTLKFTLKLYFPSFVIISSMFTGYIIIRLSGFIIRRARLANIENLPFSMLKAPRSMSLIAIVFYSFYIFMSRESEIWPVIANVVMILYTIIGICGLSFIDFKLMKKIHSGFIRFIIYLAVFFLGGALMSIISNILIIIGILDGTRDFRGIGNSGESV